jgi:hypothetical protein
MIPFTNGSEQNWRRTRLPSSLPSVDESLSQLRQRRADFAKVD